MTSIKFIQSLHNRKLGADWGVGKKVQEGAIGLLQSRLTLRYSRDTLFKTTKGVNQDHR